MLYISIYQGTKSLIENIHKIIEFLFVLYEAFEGERLAP